MHLLAERLGRIDGLNVAVLAAVRRKRSNSALLRHLTSNGFAVARQNPQGYDGVDCTALKANSVAQLTVRKVSQEVVSALKQRAVANGRSAEAEHREILRTTLLGRSEDFAARAEQLRRRLRSSVDSTDTIRRDRERDTAR